MFIPLWIIRYVVIILDIPIGISTTLHMMNCAAMLCKIRHCIGVDASCASSLLRAKVDPNLKPAATWRCRTSLTLSMVVKHGNY